ncbi:hypothetical protein [Streptomyces sp. Go-475]|uniref:hypothetical protein n=1 Tax=Streptomyces sp. Go-475 TaxID=2072505 RepID=UPI000DF03F7C|nr:hypothetical protein [Streptomyces sp. Go-475]AXE83865.1 hypothetical protein C1703_02565 [Streptomyces sp. Go-475]
MGMDPTMRSANAFSAEKAACFSHNPGLGAPHWTGSGSLKNLGAGCPSDHVTIA